MRECLIIGEIDLSRLTIVPILLLVAGLYFLIETLLADKHDAKRLALGAALLVLGAAAAKKIGLFSK